MRNGNALFDKFEIQKDSMFSVKYYDNFTLYTDSEHTNVYDDDTGFMPPAAILPNGKSFTLKELWVLDGMN
jgi:hypothetical protein